MWNRIVVFKMASFPLYRVDLLFQRVQLKNAKIINLLLFRASVDVDTFKITLHIDRDRVA